MGGDSHFFVYNDGDRSIVFDTPGEKLTVGHDSKHKYTRNLYQGGDSRIVVTTESGSRYLFTDGAVFGLKHGVVQELGDQARFDLELGKDLSMVGIFSTPIKKIDVFHSFDANVAKDFKPGVETDSPFAGFEDLRKQLRQQRASTERTAPQRSMTRGFFSR
jgi:hypothetical protein